MSTEAKPFTHEVQFPLKGFLPDPPAGKTIKEPARDVPVMAEVDVAVFGGGPAGVCAAAAAARAGKRVILVERHGCLGGMSTVAWVTMIHTLYGTDKKTRIIGGLPEEFLRRLQRLGALKNTAADGETGDWRICGETAKFVWDDIALSSGVRLALHTWLVGAMHDGRRVAAALVENKSGRQVILAKAYIDCTGDADLVRRAGAATTLGNPEGKCQAPTLVFRVAGKGDKAVGLREVQAELFKTPMDYNGEKYPCYLWGNPGIWSPSEQMMAGTRVLNINASDGRDFTRAEVEGRYQLRWLLGRLKTLPGWEKTYIVDVAAQVGIRETNRIVAEHRLTRDEVLHGVIFGDTIAQGTYPVDIHSPDSPGIIFDHLDGRRVTVGGDAVYKTGRWDGEPAGAPKRTTLCWRVPYGCLVPKDLDNVLAAGRCIGADHEAAGAIRVMINCMQFGQAAGTAAAILPDRKAFRDLDGKPVRQALLAAGAALL
ncbi:MAG: FAD-dependent oxidoreductase [Planctomycetota bacterium]|nr:FAD-dependent oxidoreductase [Planctomycetota bacterium]